MKKTMPIILVFFCICSFVGCKKEEKPKFNPSFDAIVLEVGQESVLVEPFEDEEERKSADKIKVPLDVLSTNEVPALEEGMEICVVYNGEIMESSPAKLGTVFAIYFREESEKQ